VCVCRCPCVDDESDLGRCEEGRGVGCAVMMEMGKKLVVESS
jgi:hypothetical protein